jgi:hypothetical protein
MAERHRPCPDGYRHAGPDRRGLELYPSFTGPIVLVGAAIFVALGPGRWTPFVGFGVPLVLGIGANVAAIMTGAFVDQLTRFRHLAIVIGSGMHVIGLTTAVIGGVGMLLDRRGLVSGER